MLMGSENSFDIYVRTPEWEPPEFFHDIIAANLKGVADEVEIDNIPDTENIRVRGVSVTPRTKIADILMSIGATEIDL
jgi:hypothetical protein